MTRSPGSGRAHRALAGFSSSGILLVSFLHPVLLVREAAEPPGRFEVRFRRATATTGGAASAPPRPSIALREGEEPVAALAQGPGSHGRSKRSRPCPLRDPRVRTRPANESPGAGADGIRSRASTCSIRTRITKLPRLPFPGADPGHDLRYLTVAVTVRWFATTAVSVPESGLRAPAPSGMSTNLSGDATLASPSP